MFRKEGLKKMTLSFILAVALASGVASIGYCGGGAGNPPERHLQGPGLVGTAIMTEDVDDLDGNGKGIFVDFIGTCTNANIDATATGIGQIDLSETQLIVPTNKNEMIFVRVSEGQDKIGFCLHSTTRRWRR